jgi:UDP-N-acetylmuramoyl-tripeptide--D-alanyl-D-alanine ligase
VTRAEFPLSAAAVAAVVGGRVARGDAAKRFAAVSIDSRTVAPGALFVAIRGDRLDGHAFVAEAVAKGAGGVVVSDPTSAAGLDGAVPVVVVDDTTGALQELARHVRRVSGARVVAITGSAGKTTTKEATALFLEARYRTMRNRGNLNNHIGLPLSLLELQGGAEVAVVELGMNHAGEISRLVAIADPDVRVWTNVGTAHLEYFGSQDAIAEAKAEILENARPDTVLVANADDERIMDRVPRFAGRVVTFGVARPATVRAVHVTSGGLAGSRALVRTPTGDVELETRLPGRGNLLNVLAAAAVAVDMGVSLADIASRAARLCPAAHRGEVVTLAGGVTVIDDCYNASPSAVAQALDLLAAAPAGRRRVAFLGEMLELGPGSAELHRECGRLAAGAGVGALITVGGVAAFALGEGAVAAGLPAAAVGHADDSDQAAALAGALVRDGDVVLVKGSRGVRMERVVERLKAERG